MYISADKLKELRKLSGFSQEELAEAADVSLATLQSWEQGKRVPHDIYMIKNLCNALGVSIDYLFYEEFDNSDAVYNFDISDSDDERLNTLAQQIYNQQGLTGILKLIDRFIYTVGPVHAIKIMEAYMNESNSN